MLFKLKKLFNYLSGHFNRLLLVYAFKGVKNEADETKQRYIIYLNLIGIITFGVTIISAIIFFFCNEFLAAFAILISGIFFLVWPFYFNRNGLKLGSRVGLIVYTNAILVIAACLFSHNSSLDKYYLCVAVNCNFMYTQKEKKWLLFSLFITLSFFIIESTSLQSYLPAFDLINNFQRGDKIILVGLIVTVVLDVLAAVYINSLREQHLLSKQKLLEEAQRRVLIQNDDLKAFSIAASHSMQTPLHVSRYFLKQIMEKKYLQKTDADYKNYITIIGNGLSQIEQLVSGLFSYNRIINLENEVDTFDITKEANRIKKFITPRYPFSIVIVPNKGPQVLLNRMLFSVIIQNLIDNALRYNQSAVPEVELEFTVKNGELEILVKDNGIGIPEIYFDSIFIPFKRIQPNADLTVGNGLGLAGARRAAERMGGSLICLASSKNGTVFKLSIPIVAKHESEDLAL